jgi:hypothetical protein
MLLNVFSLTAILAGFFGLAGIVLGEDSSPLGLWKTLDDRTGQVRGTVLVYERNGLYHAKIASAVNPKEANDICDLCPGGRKNKPVVGLVIMENMRKSGAEYTGGEVLDPDTGYIYRGKFRLIEGGQKMVLRGFIGISLLGRSQTWIR